MTIGIHTAEIDRHALDVIGCALRAAEDEIHNPGAARAGNYDVLDLIDQAKALVRRAKNGEPAQGIPDDPPSHITDPQDDGSCDPLYGQRMDSADCGEC